MKYSISLKTAYPEGVQYKKLPNDLVDVSQDDHERIANRAIGDDFVISADGTVTIIPMRPSAAYDWDGAEWVLNNAKQAELDAAARKAAVPHVVTMRQAKLALLQAGMLDEVDAAIAAEATPKSIKIEWEYASEVQRDWVNTLGLATRLGMTDEQLDDLFVLAASL